MSHLADLCDMLPRVVPAQREELLCQIHDAAGRMPYQDDRDQTALILESVGDDSKDPELRRLCYTHAIYRARWCAQSATSGSEGLSRAAHVNGLEQKLKKSIPQD